MMYIIKGIRHVLTLSDLSIELDNIQAAIWHVHVKLLFLSLHYLIWILRLIKSMIELINFMMHHFL